MSVFRFPVLFNLLIITILFAGCDNKENQAAGDKSNYKGFESLPSSKTNITNSNDIPESGSLNHLIWDSYYNGGGVAAGDINNDGLVDLYFTNTMKENELYLNKGNLTFENI